MTLRPSALDSHRSASQGSASNVARFTRIRRACVRWPTVSDGVVGGHVWIEGVRIGANRGHHFSAADGRVGGGRAIGHGTEEERQRGEQ